METGEVVVTVTQADREEAGMERAARHVDRLAMIAAASPFWQSGTDQQLEELARRIREHDHAE